MADLRLKPLPPRDAVRYFQGKGLRLTRSWTEMSAEDHSAAFTISGLRQLDQLALVQRTIDSALRNGTSVNDVVRDLTGRVALSPERLRFVVDTNIRVAHSAGRFARYSDSPLPYMVYTTMGDERVRPLHAQWHGVALAKEDPWWNTHYPPNGWRCRCRAVQTDEAGLKKRGLTVRDEAPEQQLEPWRNPATGETRRIDRGVDPGWDYHPGKSALPRLRASFAERADQMPKALLPHVGAVVRTHVERVAEAWAAKPSGVLPLTVATKGEGAAGSASVLTSVKLRAEDAKRFGLLDAALLLALAAALDEQEVQAPGVVVLEDGRRVTIDGRGRIVAISE